MKNIFEFDDYREFLLFLFSKANPQPVTRADLCRYLKCQASFLSQVISGKTHLSLEHAILVSQFLKHDSDEKKFFLLLVQMAKSGNETLRTHFQEQIKFERDQKQPVKTALNLRDELSAEDQAVYYSHWWYAAIHILVAFPEFRSMDGICKRLRIDAKTANEATEFLVTRGLIQKVGNEFRIGKTRIHLGSKSPLIARHHINWRTKCIDLIERRNNDDIHFSGVIGISRDGAKQVKSTIMDLLKKTEQFVRDTNEEAPFVLLVDFLEL